MSLMGGNQLDQVQDEVLHVSVRLVEHMWFGLLEKSLFSVVTIRRNGRIHGADNAIGIGDDLFHCFTEVHVISCSQQLLNIRCVFEPCGAMNMGASTVMPLKAVPVNLSTYIEGFYELTDRVGKKPICNSWILRHGSAAAGAAVRWSGQMRRASSGHWLSAALWVKNTVDMPRVSTMENSLFFYL